MATSKKQRRSISIPETTSYYVEQVHDKWIDTVNREMWIHGIDMNTDSYDGEEPGVEYMMATKVIKNLYILRKQSETEPIVIHLHTCGGMYEEGMAIYDTIMAMPYWVTIISYTHARSMSSIILQAGDERLLMPNSSFMFHLGTLGMEGEVRTVHSMVDFCKKYDQKMIDIYVQMASHGSKFKGWTEIKIRNKIVREMEKKTDVFLTAEEAIEWGFADSIMEQWPN